MNRLTRSQLLPPADSDLGATLHLLWEHSPILVLSGFLFGLAGVPAFSLFLAGYFVPALLLAAGTIVPAWTALLSLELGIVADRAPSIAKLPWRLMRSFGGAWFSATLFGLLAVFPLAMLLATLPLLSVPNAPPLVWLGLIADLWLIGTLIALSFYVLPLIISEKIGLFTALRKAAALASHRIAQTIGLLSMGICTALTISFLSSGLWFLLPSIWGLFIAYNYHSMQMATQRGSLQ